MKSRDSIVYTPVSLGPDTDDEETLVNVEVYNNGESYKIRIVAFHARHWVINVPQFLVDHVELVAPFEME